MKKIQKESEKKDYGKKETSLKKYIFPLIMSIITFLIGSFFVYNTIGVPLKAELVILLASYLPTILFIIITILMYKYNKSKKIIKTVNILSIILTCILLFYYYSIILLLCLL